MDWTGATNSPTITVSNVLNLLGSLTTIGAMTFGGASNIEFEATDARTITTNGTAIDVSTLRFFGSNVSTGSWTLQDNLTTKTIYLRYGTLITANFNITCSGQFYDNGQTAISGLTLGNSVITCADWSFNPTNFTLNAGSSTIKVTTTGTFGGGGLTYHNVELNSTAHTISGDNSKFKAIKVGRAAAVTITGTAGETYTVESFFATDNNNTLTMDSTGAAWTLTGNSGYCELNYTNLTNVVAGYKYMYYAGDVSTDGTGNTNWIFTRKVRQQMFPRG